MTTQGKINLSQGWALLLLANAKYTHKQQKLNQQVYLYIFLYKYICLYQI